MLQLEILYLFDLDCDISEKIKFYKDKQSVDYLGTWDCKTEYLKEIAMLLLRYSVEPSIENASHIILSLELVRTHLHPNFHIDYHELDLAVKQFAEL